MSAPCPTPAKRPHPNYEAALAHMKWLRKSKGANSDLHPYRCRCGSWHVGHSVVSFRRRIRNALRGAS